MARAHVTDHSTYIHSEIQDVTKIAQTFHDQASTAMFVPSLWWPADTLSLVGSAKDPEGITDHRDKWKQNSRVHHKQLLQTNRQHYYATMLLSTVQHPYCRATLGWQDIQSLHSKLDFVGKSIPEAYLIASISLVGQWYSPWTGGLSNWGWALQILFEKLSGTS